MCQNSSQQKVAIIHPLTLFLTSSRHCRSKSVIKAPGCNRGTPCSAANLFAPVPAISTCSLFSITRRATLTACLMSRKPATAPEAKPGDKTEIACKFIYHSAPAFRSRPSMTSASISTSPSRFNTLPVPE